MSVERRSHHPLQQSDIVECFHNIFYMICFIYHPKTVPLLDYESQESEEELFLIFIVFEIPVSDRNSCHCVMTPKFWDIPMPKFSETKCFDSWFVFIYSIIQLLPLSLAVIWIFCWSKQTGCLTIVLAPINPYNSLISWLSHENIGCLQIFNEVPFGLGNCSG